jgi:hypothetical protein
MRSSSYRSRVILIEPRHKLLANTFSPKYFVKTTFCVLDEFLLASIQVWEKNSDLKNLTKS